MTVWPVAAQQTVCTVMILRINTGVFLFTVLVCHDTFLSELRCSYTWRNFTFHHFPCSIDTIMLIGAIFSFIIKNKAICSSSSHGAFAVWIDWMVASAVHHLCCIRFISCWICVSSWFHFGVLPWFSAFTPRQGRIVLLFPVTDVASYLQCFDLESYLQLNCERGTWRCPVCK